MASWVAPARCAACQGFNEAPGIVSLLPRGRCRPARKESKVAKLLVFGQAQFGARVFEGLRAAAHDVLAACLPPDREGRDADPLKQAAEMAGVRVVQRKSYKSAEAGAEVAAEHADLGVLAYVTQIIPRPILDAPRLASVCFHPSLLPAYRGGSAINWQLINGETRGGITVFRPDDGIDAGPIYMTREIDIGPDDSAGSYYYSKVFEPGVAAMLETVESILAGDAVGVAQDESTATHDPLCRDEHAAIDWSRPAKTLHDLVRGCDPSPGARALHGGHTVRVYGSRVVTSDPRGEPGKVVAVSEAGIEIACGDGSLLFAKMAVGGKKLAAAEAAAAAGIGVGARLASAS
jgi:methionyl-tRNA formyltransferase